MDLAYGQIGMTPRHDHFIQAKYLNKLPFGKTASQIIPPRSGYRVSGPAPIPKEYREHVQEYLKMSSCYKNLKFS